MIKQKYIAQEHPIVEPELGPSEPTAKKEAALEAERKDARRARRLQRLEERNSSATDLQEVLSAFLTSVRNGEEGPDSSMPFDNLDNVLEGLAALGELMTR